MKHFEENGQTDGQRNANLWHLRDHIFENLSHEDVLNCRRVCKYWNESLRRLSDVKFIQEFGERDVEETNEKMSIVIPGWKNAAQKYGVQASMDDIEKVKDSLKNLAEGKGKCVRYPVHEAARNGYVKLMEFILKTSFDMNTKDGRGWTAWHWACENGQTETAQLIIQNSEEFDIDLNAKSSNGSTALHLACKIVSPLISRRPKALLIFSCCKNVMKHKFIITLIVLN